MYKSSRGFTLLEIMLVIALVSVVAGFSIPVYQQLQVDNDLNIAVNTLAQTLRRAQALSQASDGDTTWGVHTATSTIVLFQGASYAARDSDFDEVFDTGSEISFTGSTDYVFDQLTGSPQSTGTTSLTNITTNFTRTLNVNSKGTISY